MGGGSQAKRVAASRGERRPSGDGLSPSLASEVLGAIERALRLHKAETIAAEIGVSKQFLYKRIGEPSKIPIGWLEAIAAFDPDPDFLPRLAGHLLATISRQALARQAAGRAIAVIHELSPGRFVRTEEKR